MTKKELEKMAKYFLKEYFHNIPYIPCTFRPESEFLRKENGRFCMEEGEDYDPEEDELMDAPEYRFYDDESPDGMIHHTWNQAPSWTDALNKPKLHIEINRKLQKDPLKVTGVLLHELAHYYCWYCGYDYEDSSEFFDGLMKKLGLPSNFRDRAFNHDKREWEETFDYNTMERHYRKFKNAEKERQL